MSNDIVIQLEELTKKYGSFTAVDHLNLSIKKGEIFGLLGPNGAGKTTTILMLLGLTIPTSGTAMVCGYNATSNPIPVKRKVGYMPDSVGFYDNLTALENLEYIAALNGVAGNKISALAKEKLEQVGLINDLHKKTGAFSRGMKQRLGLADVLIKDPEVIILDEPTLGIDPSGVKEFLNLIVSLSKQQQLTVLLSSHHLHQMQQVCDRVGIFVDGQLKVEGAIGALSKTLFGAENIVTSIQLDSPIQNADELKTWLGNLEGVEQVDVNHSSLDVGCSTDITPDLVRLLVDKDYGITGVQRKEFGLDEIYQKYFENNLTENKNNGKSGNSLKTAVLSRFRKK